MSYSVKLFLAGECAVEDTYVDTLKEAKERARHLVSPDFQVTAGIDKESYGDVVARVYRGGDCLFEC